MHFWQNNPKPWKWNWPPVPSLFMITNYSGIRRKADSSRSWMPTIMCLSFKPTEVLDDLVQDFPAFAYSKVSSSSGNSAWCQQKGIKLSGVSIFIPTYSLSKATQVLPPVRETILWLKCYTGGIQRQITAWNSHFQNKRFPTPSGLLLISYTFLMTKARRRFTLDSNGPFASWMPT